MKQIFVVTLEVGDPLTPRDIVEAILDKVVVDRIVVESSRSPT